MKVRIQARISNERGHVRPVAEIVGSLLFGATIHFGWSNKGVYDLDNELDCIRLGIDRLIVAQVCIKSWLIDADTSQIIEDTTQYHDALKIKSDPKQLSIFDLGIIL